MTDTRSTIALAWLLTYAIHSTVLLGLAWVMTRRIVLAPAARDFVWKIALLGAVVTASAQLQLGLRPLGSMSLVHEKMQTVSSDFNGGGGGVPRRSTDIAPYISPLSSPLVAPGGALPVTDLGEPAPSSSPQRLGLASILVLAWAAAALLMTLAYAARRLVLAGRLTDRRVVVDGELPIMLDSLCNAAAYRGKITLTTATTISSPVALGFSEICVPVSALTDLDPAQQRSLLAHELAHLIRRDPLWLIGAGLIERVFFFQPLNRLGRRELQHAAEYVCDDWAATRTGSGLPLAECLARVAEWIQASPLGVPVAGMAEQRSLLVERIARLIEGRSAGSRGPRVVVAGISMVLLAAVVAAAPSVQSGPAAPVRAPAGDALRAKLARAPRVGVRVSAPQLAPGAPAATSEDTAVVNALIERLKDTDAGVRKAAAGSLGNLKSRRAVTGLIAASDDKDTDVRVAVVEALGSIGDDRAVHALSLRIGDVSPDVREHALEALTGFAHSVPADVVIAALRDARSSVREKAAELLGEIGDGVAVGPLSRLLKDPSPDVRERAIHALENIKDPSAEPAVRAALTDQSADVRVAALRALGELKVMIGERTIIDALNDSSAEMRQTGARLAGESGTPGTIPALRRALDDSVGEVREAAVDALAQFKGPGARDALRAALKSTDAAVRRRATEALGERP